LNVSLQDCLQHCFFDLVDVLGHWRTGSGGYIYIEKKSGGAGGSKVRRRVDGQKSVKEE